MTRLERETTQGLSRAELLAKADQLEKPSFFVARARIGLSLLLLGQSDNRVLEMIADGRPFLEILERDWEYEQRSKSSSQSEPSISLIDNRDRLYQPSEVLPADISNIEQAISGIRNTLDKLLTPSTREEVEREEIQEVLVSLGTFGHKYMKCFGETLGEYKFGTLVRSAF